MVGVLRRVTTMVRYPAAFAFSICPHCVHRISKLYFSRYEIKLWPSTELDETLAEFKEKFPDRCDEKLQRAYDKAAAKLEELRPYESAIETSESPHLDEWRAYIEYERKCGDPARIQFLYERALVDNCLNAELWIDYATYLEKVLKVRDMTLFVYEKATRNCPWATSIWLNYIQALERFQQPFAQVTVWWRSGKESCRDNKICSAVPHTKTATVFGQSFRCPPEAIWRRSPGKMTPKEERNVWSELDSFLAVFEKAKGCGYSEASELLKLWISWLSFLRRRIDLDNITDLETNEDVAKLRREFEKANYDIFQCYGRNGDPNCVILQYWARLEARYFKRIDKFREVWNEIMSRGHGTDANMWLRYFELERAFGDRKHCRAVIQKALNSVTDDIDRISSAYVLFEREEGTLEQLDHALGRVETQLARISERQSKLAERGRAHGQPGGDGGGNLSKRKQKQLQKQLEREKQNKQQQDNSPQGSSKKVFQGREAQKRSWEAQSPPPKSDGKQNQNVDGQGGKWAKLDTGKTVVQSPVEQRGEKKSETLAEFALPQARPPKARKERVPDKSSAENVTSIHPMHRALTVASPSVQTATTAAESPETKDSAGPSENTEEHNARTVFVSNLSFDLEEASLRELLEPCGEIASITMPTKASGKFRGFAYVTFTLKTSAENARKLDRCPIQGRPAFVSPFAARRETRQSPFKYSSGEDKMTIFIKNLPFSVTKQALETIFTQHGKVKDVRMVTQRSGAPKGLAYVEFEDEVSAEAAVEAGKKGIQIGDKVISVAISNPPARQARGHAGGGGGQSQRFLGAGSKKDDFGRGRGRTMVSFVPRALSKSAGLANEKPAPSAAANGVAGEQLDDELSTNKTLAGGSGDQPKTGLSNQAFRDIFVKKSD